jgi:deoxyribose-phosphate aldolase
MNIKQYLDSTYLKTAQQANISKAQSVDINLQTIKEAINFDFKLVMIRPEFVSIAKKMILEAKSKVIVGTVIDFPLGQNSTQSKLDEAEKAIQDGVDDLDFVINYEAYKQGDLDLVKDQVLQCSALGLQNHKTVKWIIEVAALNDSQIIGICTLIKNTIISNFKEDQYESVFVKSSTGFYETKNGLPNGATIPTIKIMLENSFPLPVKAAGGVRNYTEALEMIKLGVKRIGTSAAKTIVQGFEADNDY